MGAIRGALTGVLGLVALETVVQKDASQRVGGLIGGVVSIVDRGLDPGVALIPDLRKKQPSSGGVAPAPKPPAATPTPTPRLPPVTPVPSPRPS